MRRVREALESGHPIVVMGWRNKYHNQFTTGLSSTKLVKFYDRDRPPKCLGTTVGLVLCAESTEKHSHTCRIKDSRVIGILISHQVIIHILKSCEDLLIVRPHGSTANTASGVAATEPIVDAGAVAVEYQILDFITTPIRRCKMSTMGKFAQAFLKAAENKRTPSFVGKRVLGALIREHGVQMSPVKLTEGGWIIGKTGGKQIGSYAVGPEMLKVIQQEESLPEDPIERAKVLIAKEPELLARRSELAEQLAAVDKDIDVVKFLKVQLDQIKKTVEGLTK